MFGVLTDVSAMKDFNLSRHYTSMHKAKYDKYTGAARAAIITHLKAKIQKEQKFFIKATTTQKSSLKTSCAISLELAESKKALSDGKMVKRCAIEMAKAFGDDSMVKNFESMSLSRRKVTCWIFDFQLALEESTNVTHVSQLLTG